MSGRPKTTTSHSFRLDSNSEAEAALAGVPNISEHITRLIETDARKQKNDACAADDRLAEAKIRLTEAKIENEIKKGGLIVASTEAAHAATLANLLKAKLTEAQGRARYRDGYTNLQLTRPVIHEAAAEPAALEAKTETEREAEP